MYKLTKRIKNKLVHDLSLNPIFNDVDFKWENNLLVCTLHPLCPWFMDFSPFSEEQEYDDVLDTIVNYIGIHFAKAEKAHEYLLSLSYRDLVYNTTVIRHENINIESLLCQCQTYYAKDDFVYVFVFQTEYKGLYHFFPQPLTIHILTELLATHNISIKDFFQDVAKCYLDNGIDISESTHRTPELFQQLPKASKTFDNNTNALDSFQQKGRIL